MKRFIEGESQVFDAFWTLFNWSPCFESTTRAATIKGPC
jgi:hypothetical protein